MLSNKYLVFMGLLWAPFSLSVCVDLDFLLLKYCKNALFCKK